MCCIFIIYIENDKAKKLRASQNLKVREKKVKTRGCGNLFVEKNNIGRGLHVLSTDISVDSVWLSCVYIVVSICSSVA